MTTSRTKSLVSLLVFYFFYWFFILVRSQVMSLLEDGTISNRKAEKLCQTCLVFHLQTLLYALCERCNQHRSSKKLPSHSKKLKNALQNSTKKRLMKHLNC